MKKVLLFCLGFLLFFNCTQSNEVSNYLNCNSNFLSESTIKEFDAKYTFSVQIPKNWNINLYTDELQSSIFIADTTKQLSETLLLDFSIINKKISLNSDFLLQEELNQLQNKLVKVKEINLSTKTKQEIVLFYRGKKKDLPYQTMHHFIVYDANFMHIKAEVYGTSKIKERFCEAQNILNTLKIN